MKSSKDLLSSVLKTAQMGQTGIRSVLKTPLKADLQSVLRAQLQEYDSIEQEAQAIAISRGWELESLDPAAKIMANMTTRSRLTFGRNDSKIAAMMIYGNTKGMIKGLKNLHHSVDKDPSITALTQKILDCERDHIRQLQGFI